MRTSKKLSPHYLGPYRIAEHVREVSYKLDLPANMKIHNVFHISKLRPYQDPTSFHSQCIDTYRPPPIVIDKVDEYEIKDIVDRQYHHGRLQYLVHWKGYNNTEDTWIDAANLPHSQELIEDFEDDLPLDRQFTS